MLKWLRPGGDEVAAAELLDRYADQGSEIWYDEDGTDSAHWRRMAEIIGRVRRG